MANPEYSLRDLQYLAPQMIFGLLNIKVNDIQAGDYHSMAVGTPKNANAAISSNLTNGVGF